jgi:hypothetical protein
MDEQLAREVEIEYIHIYIFLYTLAKRVFPDPGGP